MLLRSDPFGDFDRLTARVFDTTVRNVAPRAVAHRAGVGRPVADRTGARLDAYRDGDAFIVDVDLPGVDPSGIDVTVDHKVLTIRAERRRPTRDGVQFLREERPMGTVTRQLFLSDTLDTDRLQASYDAGVLTLRIPVTERAKPRRIDVAVGATDRATVDVPAAEELVATADKVDAAA